MTNLLFDAFMFNDELDLLEFRLEELWDVVDTFVVCEADRTFTGVPRESMFDGEARRFERFSSKIIRLCVPLDEEGTAWRREEQQRRGLRDKLLEIAAPDDVVIIGDVDEIPDRDLLVQVSAGIVAPTRLGMQHAIYYANLFLPEYWDDGPMVVSPRRFDHPMVRTLLGDPHSDWDGYQERTFANAGWHLSFLGGLDAIRAKLGAFSHQELNTEENRDITHLSRCLDLGVHLDGRRIMRYADLEGLSPTLHRLHDKMPAFFRFDVRPREVAARAYRAYANLRRPGRLPEGSRRWFDAHPTAITGAGALPFATVDLLLQAKRRQRKPSWKSPYFINWRDELPQGTV